MNIHLYDVKPFPPVFDCGATRTGHQILMGLYCPHIVCVQFGADGHYARTDLRPLAIPRLKADPSIFDISSGPVREHIAEQMREHQLSLGFTQRPIRIYQFALADRAIGIRDMPAYLMPPNWPRDAERREQTSRLAHDWVQSGRFVLVWGEEYWLERDGSAEI